MQKETAMKSLKQHFPRSDASEGGTTVRPFKVKNVIVRNKTKRKSESILQTCSSATMKESSGFLFQFDN